jgi:hypothetical protein
MSDSSYNYEKIRPSKSLMLKIENALTSMFGMTVTLKKQLQAVPMTQRFLLLGVMLIIIILLIFIIKQYKANQKLKKYFTEPVFICNINGKCPFDQSFGPHNASKTYKFYNSPNAQGTNYAPNRYLKGSPSSFSLGFWFYINALPEGNERWNQPKFMGKWKHIMHIGHVLNKNDETTLQSPGFWFLPEQNKMLCTISTYNGPKQNENTIINNIPLNKWTNVMMVVQNRVMDIYINGKLEKSKSLLNQPREEKGGNLYITNNGGFPGFLSYVQYYDKSLAPHGVMKAYNYYKKDITKFINKLEKNALAHPNQNDWIMDNEFSQNNNHNDDYQNNCNANN